MKRVLICIILVAVLVTAAFAGACKTGKTGWSITPNASKPQLRDVAVKGSITNGGQVLLTTVIVTYEIYRKSDNRMVAAQTATLDNVAPRAQVNFVTRPAMIVESQVNVNTAYYFKLKSITERTSEK